MWVSGERTSCTYCWEKYCFTVASQSSGLVRCKWGHSRVGSVSPRNAAHPTPTTSEQKQTYGENSSSRDVKGVESKGGAPGADVETAAFGFQQHGAIVEGRRLETPAALETWRGRGKVSDVHGLPNYGRLSDGSDRRMMPTVFCWAPCQRGSVIHVFSFSDRAIDYHSVSMVTRVG